MRNPTQISWSKVKSKEKANKSIETKTAQARSVKTMNMCYQCINLDCSSRMRAPIFVPQGGKVGAHEADKVCSNM